MYLTYKGQKHLYTNKALNNPLNNAPNYINTKKPRLLT